MDLPAVDEKDPSRLLNAVDIIGDSLAAALLLLLTGVTRRPVS
jgi:hypothetical protein